MSRGMKNMDIQRVVNFMKYDTETATELARDDNGLGYQDFNDCEERLYITKQGRYFVAGKGGARTRWASHHGDSSSSGQGIEPLTKEEAIAWCEFHIGWDVETIEKHFDIEEA